MAQLFSLPTLIVEPLVRAALFEDLGRAGDLTTNAIVPRERQATTVIAAREAGVVAGLDLVNFAFKLMDPNVEISVERGDCSVVAAGDIIATVSGPARAILTGERTALNFLTHLSGIATATRHIVDAVVGQKARIVCTRKTSPGLRAIEKYAVRAGGGSNHRFGLDDAVLIKDNHIAVAGGIRPAIERVRGSVGHLVKIEIEVDTLVQLEEAMELAPDAVLLDNMTPDELRRAVAMVSGRALTEASGRITAATVSDVAASGVDLISIGWLTHSAPILDIGLDYKSP